MERAVSFTFTRFSNTVTEPQYNTTIVYTDYPENWEDLS